MRASRRRGHHKGGSEAGASGLAVMGWLFADLMIGLFIVALATQSAPLAGRAADGPPATTPPPATDIGSPDADGAPDARMEQVARIVSIEVDPKGLVRGGRSAEAATRRAIADGIAALEEAGRQAAVVLVWGYAPEVGEGMAIAAAAADQLSADGAGLFSGAVTRRFWHGGEAGRVTLEIYLLGDGL